jgi:hypothetical protein
MMEWFEDDPDGVGLPGWMFGEEEDFADGFDEEDDRRTADPH